MIYSPEYYQKYKDSIKRANEKYRKSESGRIKTNERTKRWRENHPEQARRLSRNGNRKVKMEILIYYGGNPPKCACCGEGHIEFLSIDHIDGDGVKQRLKATGKKRASNSLYYWIKRNNYPVGFQVLCMNCNCAKGWYGCCPHQKEKKNAIEN